MLTQIQTEYMFPPAADLQPCELPFNAPPTSDKEGAKRDVVWLTYFIMCADKVDKTRKWVEDKRADK